VIADLKAFGATQPGPWGRRFGFTRFRAAAPAFAPFSERIVTQALLASAEFRYVE